MKQSLLILGLLLMGIGQAFSQNYYYYTSTGTTPPFNWDENSATATTTTLIAAPANDVLSASQALPFDWTFYGKTVTSYRASDNGYITFDGAATKSLPNSVALPDTTAASPKSAIFAFWTDLSVQSIPAGETAIPASVICWTYGSEPNRVHVIQWTYVAKEGVAVAQTNLLIFSIRLYEGGGFDIVHTDDQGSYNNAAIGVQDSDGKVGDMVDGSPYLGAPNPNGAGANATDYVYNFNYGAQPKNDAAMVTPSVSTSNNLYRRTLPTFVINDNLTISATINNRAGVPITSLTANYSVDGGSMQSQKITGLSIPRNSGTYPFSYQANYTPSSPGYHTIKLWLSGINDSFSEYTTYDTTTTQIFIINGGTFNLTMQPLLECCTGAWCGFCPNGHICLKNEEINYPYAITIDYHWDDLMTNQTSNDICSVPILNPGFPSILVNRILFPGNQYVSIQNSAPNDNSALDQVVAQVANNSSSIPVSLDILTKSWDPGTRTIKFTVTGKFADYAGGDIRLNAFIVEDSVRGPDIESIEQGAVGAQPGWDQHNYYSSTENGNGVATSASLLWNEPQYMVGYVHNGVEMQALTGDWGININGLSGTNQTIAPGTTFSQTFTTTLPAQVNVDYSKTVKTPDSTQFHSTFPGYGYNKPESIRLVAFISNYNANDPTYGEVLNAAQQPLLGWSAGIATYNPNVDKISLYPNPAANSASVQYTLAKATDLSIDVYNVMGQRVQNVQSGSQMAGMHTLRIDASNLSNGLYFVSFTSNGEKTTKQLMIQK